MSLSKRSELHILMLQSSANGFLSIAQGIIEILKADNDLSPEQIEFWQDQGNRLIEFADCYFEIASESVALEEHRQSSIKKLIPFVNVKNAGLN